MLERVDVNFRLAGEKAEQSDELLALGQVRHSKHDGIYAEADATHDVLLTIRPQQGTWQPGFRGTTTAGSWTYGVREGTWVRIHEWVFFQFQLRSTGQAGSAGELELFGFEFPITGFQLGGGSVYYVPHGISLDPDFYNGYLDAFMISSANNSTAWRLCLGDPGASPISIASVSGGSMYAFGSFWAKVVI